MLCPVTIRLAHASDATALRRLAERDTRALPQGLLLVAEREGTIDAALSLETAECIADPFKPTAELLDLLRTHAGASRRPPRRAARPLALRLA